MNLKAASKALDIEKWRLKGALERRNAHYVEDFSPPYILLKKDLRHLERGTAVFLGAQAEVVRGFPKIPRAFYLEPMLKKHFEDRVVVEEKMNGYNARACMVEGKLLAITRGGFVCPYTTSKLREEKGLAKFLSQESGLVACGEIVGRENPYVAHEYPEARRFGFFCFDLRAKSSGQPLKVKERRSLLENYSVPQVRLLAEYKKEHAAEGTFEHVKALAREGREGVVLKDPDMNHSPIKYTPSQTNTQDLAYAFRFPYEYGRDFFFSRIIREGYQAVEWEDSKEEMEERAQRLGESILYPMVESIRRIKTSERMLSEDYEVRAGSREEMDTLSDFLRRRGINFTLERRRSEDGSKIYLIQRLRNSSTDKIKSVLRGKGK